MIKTSSLDSMESVELRASTDEVKTDLEVVCDLCGATLCDAEAGDTLAVLVRVGADHLSSHHAGITAA